MEARLAVLRKFDEASHPFVFRELNGVTVTHCREMAYCATVGVFLSLDWLRNKMSRSLEGTIQIRRKMTISIIEKLSVSYTFLVLHNIINIKVISFYTLTYCKFSNLFIKFIILIIPLGLLGFQFPSVISYLKIIKLYFCITIILMFSFFLYCQKDFKKFN